MHVVYYIIPNDVLKLHYLSCAMCLCSVCVLPLCNCEMSVCVVVFWSFMVDAFAVWQTNYMFNVEQIVFWHVRMMDVFSEGFMTCVAAITCSQVTDHVFLL